MVTLKSLSKCHSSLVPLSLALKQNCLSDVTPNKQMYRWEHEDIIDNYVSKMKTPQAKKIVRKRGSIVEHPFGTIKRTLGWDHFLVRTKKKVLGENALIMFTYNFRRLLNLIGIDLFKKLCKAIKENDLSQIREEIAAYILLSEHYLTFFLEYIFYTHKFYKKVRFIR